MDDDGRLEAELEKATDELDKLIERGPTEPLTSDNANKALSFTVEWAAKLYGAAARRDLALHRLRTAVEERRQKAADAREKRAEDRAIVSARYETKADAIRHEVKERDRRYEDMAIRAESRDETMNTLTFWIAFMAFFSAFGTIVSAFKGCQPSAPAAPVACPACPPVESRRVVPSPSVCLTPADDYPATDDAE